MTDKHRQLAKQLESLEQLLRSMALWSETLPTPEALLSTEPFALDTLAFEEWLQFIFLPRLQQLIDNDGVLPGTSAVAPMAEEYFRYFGDESRALIELLSAIDQLLNDDMNN